MEVIPAIDLIEGRCVRLYQGDYARATVYEDDPVETARRWERMGARRVHVVDLDGARAGEPRNLDVIRRIAGAVGVPVQMGGGIRNLAAVREALSAGVDRVMLGTAAARNPRVVKYACAEFGEDAVVVAVDSRGGRVAVSGWTDDSDVRATDLIRRMLDAGARTFLCTDISRDGALMGPNCELMRELAGVAGGGVIAAGGVAAVKHLAALAETGVGGAVIGKALYTGDIDLAEAIRAVDAIGGKTC